MRLIGSLAFSGFVYISYQLSVIIIYSARAKSVLKRNWRHDQVLAVHVAAEVVGYVLSFDLNHESALH